MKPKVTGGPHRTHLRQTFFFLYCFQNFFEEHFFNFETCCFSFIFQRIVIIKFMTPPMIRHNCYLLSIVSTIPVHQSCFGGRNSDGSHSFSAYIKAIRVSKTILKFKVAESHQLARKFETKSCWSSWLTPNRAPISPYCLPGAVLNFINVSVTSNVIKRNRDKQLIFENESIMQTLNSYKYEFSFFLCLSSPLHTTNVPN